MYLKVPPLYKPNILLFCVRYEYRNVTLLLARLESTVLGLEARCVVLRTHTTVALEHRMFRVVACAELSSTCRCSDASKAVSLTRGFTSVTRGPSCPNRIRARLASPIVGTLVCARLWLAGPEQTLPCFVGPDDIVSRVRFHWIADTCSIPEMHDHLYMYTLPCTSSYRYMW